MNVEFVKMQSLGNDFVVIDAVRNGFHLSSDQIKKMGDRHFGVGFDQVLVLDLPELPGVDFNYRIFNADGSEVEQCGNGMRCLARFIQRYHFPNRSTFKLARQNRMISAFLEGEDVRVEMGFPEFSPNQVPFDAPEFLPAYELALENQIYLVGVVSMGNPHAVIQVPSFENLAVDKVGRSISLHPRFLNQTNVEFMEILNRNSIRLRVYERGVGETLACGSGACAAVVIGRLWGFLDEQVEVNLPGGKLQVRWNFERPVELKGSGEFVFSGVFPLT